MLHRRFIVSDELKKLGVEQRELVRLTKATGNGTIATSKMLTPVEERLLALDCSAKVQGNSI